MRFSGLHPNVAWKAHSKGMLHEHARYVPLSADTPLKQYETHNGMHIVRFNPSSPDRTNFMCTGSTAAYALGFYEKDTLEYLGLPASWANHGKTLNIIPHNHAIDTPSDIMRTHMNWGIQHESNGIRTLFDSHVLNEKYPGFSICESGTWSSSVRDRPSTGSTPDGILWHNDVPKALIEIKCRSPFWQSDDGVYHYKRVVPHENVPIYYVPQLQLQQYHIRRNIPFDGPTYFTSWTATMDTTVIEIPYDQNYAETMVELLGRFRDEFVATGNDPPENFWHSPAIPPSSQRSLYLSFLDRTLELTRQCNLMERVSSFVQSDNDPQIFMA